MVDKVENPNAQKRVPEDASETFRDFLDTTLKKEASQTPAASSTASDKAAPAERPSVDRTGDKASPINLPGVFLYENKDNKADAKPVADRAVRQAAHVEAAPATIDTRKVTLDDGRYERDAQGRVTTMWSADGQSKRAFKYEDASNPNRITSETINDKVTYKWIGPVTSGGKHVTENGMESNSYSIYENGQLKGNWAGIRNISPNGVYSIKESGSQGDIKHQGASGNTITEAQRAQREKDGIWPGQILAEHADGTKFDARLKGTKLDTLTETRKVDGGEKKIEWRKDGDKWSSDETPPRQVKNLELRKDGSLKYDELDGTTRIQNKDLTHDAITDGVTRRYDAKDRLTSIIQANGESRSLGYDENNAVSSITDKTKNGSRSWTKTGAEEWSNGTKTETRKNVEIKADGAVEYTIASGNKVRETKDFSRVELDPQEKPVRVDFNSGSSREFKYNDAGKMESFTDNIKAKDREVSRTWTREGTSDTFSQGEGDKKRTRTIEYQPNIDGDVKYLNSDKKEHISRARDVERQASGEILANSEAVQEARVELTHVAEKAGINMARFEGYMNDFEKNATKYALKPEQMAKTYDNLRQILSADKSPLYTEAQRKHIVETAMHNIAKPMEIDQGYHPTCNVTTLEVYAAARHPDEYARMCKEVTNTGSYTTQDGKVARPPKNALMPGEDETTYDLDKPNVHLRNHASQIVQMTLINGLYETGGVIDGVTKIPKTDTRYVMDKVSWQQQGNAKVKIGEDRLVDLQGNIKGRATDGGPEFTQDEVLNASKMMLGYEMPYIKGPYSIEGRPWVYDLPTADRLMDIKRKNQLPHGVPTMGGDHVQTIHDVSVDDKGNCWVLLDNQHGAKMDGWVTLADLHRTQKEKGYEIEPDFGPDRSRRVKKQ